MYISHHHKFAYFASPRTASNSVQSFLQNGGIGHESDIIYTTNGFVANPSLGVPDTLLPEERYAYNAGILKNYHMTPTQAVDRGLITLEQLREYHCFSVVRDPIERWISTLFVARDMGFWSGDPLQMMINLCRNNRIEVMKVSTDLFWDYHDYFYYGDEMVATPKKIDTVEAFLTQLVLDCGGTPSEMSNVKIVPMGTPEEFKRPVEEWLPWDCIENLRETLFHEFKFYYSA